MLPFPRWQNEQLGIFQVNKILLQKQMKIPQLFSLYGIHINATEVMKFDLNWGVPAMLSHTAANMQPYLDGHSLEWAQLAGPEWFGEWISARLNFCKCFMGKNCPWSFRNSEILCSHLLKFIPMPAAFAKANTALQTSTQLALNFPVCVFLLTGCTMENRPHCSIKQPSVK